MNIGMEIKNALTIEANGMGRGNGGFPIEVFPEKIKSIILEWHERENYVVDFSCTAMLSAAATAIGNSLLLRVKEGWVTNASLYFILVGRPGLGKTPPLMAAYRPLREIDSARALKYKEERATYQTLDKEAKANAVEPVLIQTCVGDFTQEAMLRTHDHNRRGIAVVVDEIMGMFNTIDRYNSSNLIELLLSSYSGESIIVNRVTSDPIIVERPCINLIGTTQPGPVQNLFTNGYKDNGLLDRFLFAYPMDAQIPMWVDFAENAGSAAAQWKKIITKITDELPMPLEPKILDLSPDARVHFYSWRNGNVAAVNRINDDISVGTRMFKSPLMVARLALILQILRWACDESHMEHVDLQSIKGAILLCEYFENSYKRIEALLPTKMPLSRDEQFLYMLPSPFSTKDRDAVGTKFSLKGRAALDVVNRLITKGLVKKIKNGLYEKVQPRQNCDSCENCANESENQQKTQETQIPQSAETEPTEAASHE